MNKTVQEIKNLTEAVEKGLAPLQLYSKQINDAEKAAQKAGDGIGGLSKIVSAFSQSLNVLTAPGLKFEGIMADVQIATGVTGQSLYEMGEAARKVGIDSGIGAAEAAEVFSLLADEIDVSASGGADSLRLLQQQAITLSQATGISLPQSVKTLTGTLASFNLTAAHGDKLINALVAGSKNGKASMPYLTQALNDAGGAASKAGISVEETIGALQVLNKNGVSAGAAGSELAGVMVGLSKALGVDVSQIGLTRALELLKPHMNDAAFIGKNFNNVNAETLQSLVLQSEAVGKYTSEVTNTNTAYDNAALKAETYGGKVERIKTWFDDLKISVFNATGPMLPFTEVLSGALSTAGNGIETIQQLSTAVQFLTNGQKLMSLWTSISTTATNLFSIAIKAIPAFMIVAAIGAIVAALMYAWRHFEKFRGMLYGVWAFIKTLFSNMMSLLQPAINAFNLFKEGKWAAAGKEALKVVNVKENMKWNSPVDAYTKNYAAGVEEVKQEKKEREAKANHDPAAISSVFDASNIVMINKASSGNTAATSSSAMPKLNSTTQGTGSGRNVNVRIESLVKEIKIFNNIKESAQDIRRVINEELIAAVRDFEVSTSNG